MSCACQIGQDGRAVGVLVIVGEPDRVGPVGAVAVGGAQHPAARSGAAAIADRDARRDHREVWGFLRGSSFNRAVRFSSVDALTRRAMVS